MFLSLKKNIVGNTKINNPSNRLVFTAIKPAMAYTSTRMPTIFVPHGGGPLPVLGDPTHASLNKFLKSVHTLVPKPKAIVVATAHWEEQVPTISSADKHKLLYDYYGFPAESYSLKYDAPGSSIIAKKIQQLYKSKGLESKMDEQRGWDHGTFIPMMLMFPEANIPVVQISMVHGLDAATHIKMGEALSPLRDEGVLIIGSGMSFHNMGVFHQNWDTPGNKLNSHPSKAFDDYLQEACVNSTGVERAEKLMKWANAPGGKMSHPREEHLVPLFVVAGAALEDPGKVAYSNPIMGAQISSWVFGDGATNARKTGASASQL